MNIKLTTILMASLFLISCGTDDRTTSSRDIIPLSATIAEFSPVTLKIGDSTEVELEAQVTGVADRDVTYSWVQGDSQSAATITVEAVSNTRTVIISVPVVADDETLTFTVTATADDVNLQSEVSILVPANVLPVCDAVGNLTPVGLLTAPAGRNQCAIGGLLSGDATLVDDTDWHLSRDLIVGAISSETIDGEVIATQTFNAELTIEAGASILGNDAGDYIYVTEGSGIIINGLADSPVVMSSTDSNYDGTGEWGGLIIYGDADIDYLVVAEGGAGVAIGGSSFSDNIVISGANAVDLDFIQSHGSMRDGIRLENTDADLDNILVTAATRDGIWYRDYSGEVDNLMVLHRSDSGRSGIYASESTETVTVEPTFRQVTLVGNDATSVEAGDSDREFGILFANYVNSGTFQDIIIANFANGCYEVDGTADVSGLGSNIDGVHCANEFGANTMSGVVREGDTGTVAVDMRDLDDAYVGTGNGDGLRYHSNDSATPVNFSGEATTKTFTAGWYLLSIGDTESADTATIVLTNEGLDETPGVLNRAGTSSELVRIGAVIGGDTTFDDWTVATSASDTDTFLLTLPVVDEETSNG